LSIYITGDTHGYSDIYKLGIKRFPEGRELTINDVVIIAGDFGLVWSDPPHKDELWWLNWLADKCWTTLFVCGNHDNHYLLSKLPVEDKFGGKVGKVRDNIFHLKRGEIYTIDEKKIFAFGGAKTTDMESKVLGGNKIRVKKRVEGKDWWPGELPNANEKRNAWRNLKKHGNKVDIIVAHTLPSNIIGMYDKVYDSSTGRIDDPTSEFLERVCEKVKFGKYYCGHFHDDMTIEKYTMLFDRIVRC
jgi:predicted phosphodiesterase